MKWNDLNMKQRSELMSLFLKSGIDSLSDMRKIYDEGGPLDDYKENEIEIQDSIMPSIYIEGNKRDIKRAARDYASDVYLNSGLGASGYGTDYNVYADSNGKDRSKVFDKAFRRFYDKNIKYTDSLNRRNERLSRIKNGDSVAMGDIIREGTGKAAEEILPLVIGGVGGFAEKVLDIGINVLTDGFKDSWGDLLVDAYEHPYLAAAAELTNPTNFITAGSFMDALDKSKLESLRGGMKSLNSEFYSTKEKAKLLSEYLDNMLPIKPTYSNPTPKLREFTPTRNKYIPTVNLLDWLKQTDGVIDRFNLEQTLEYIQRLKDNKIPVNISPEEVQKALNSRVDRLNKEIREKLNNGERISVFGNNGKENVAFTYNNEGKIGYVEVDENPLNNGIYYIENTSDQNIGKHIPHHTVYGTDAAYQFSRSKGKDLISARYLLNPEATLKEHKNLLYENLPQQGILEVGSAEEALARLDPDININNIKRKLEDIEFYRDSFTGEYKGFSYPEIFNDLPIIDEDGIKTYLKDPGNSDILEYMSDRPGFSQRKILGIKYPDRFPHTVYSRFPDVRSFDETFLTPDDLPYGIDFGIFKKYGGLLRQYSGDKDTQTKPSYFERLKQKYITKK